MTLFLGGWHFFFWDFLGPLWFVLKLAILIFVFIWMRTTLPRLRYDQLMRFGWKVLLPVGDDQRRRHGRPRGLDRLR